MKSLLLALALLLGTQAPLPAPVAAPPEDVETLVAELELRTDNADPDLVRKLAGLKTREALDGLLQVYEVMNSVYMRRAVLRGIAVFDTVAGEEQRALQKLMDAATASTDRELREIAVDEIAGCRNYGQAFLAMIVESGADDDIRERAMLHHVGNARDEDAQWYLGICYPSTKPKPRGTKAQPEEEEVAHPLQVLRELAFDMIVGKLELPQIVAAARDGNRSIRLRAIQELDSRGDKQAVAFAEQLFSAPNAYASDRLIAARLLIDAKGMDVVDDFIKIGTRAGTPEAFAMGLADLVAELDDPKLKKRLLKDAGKGKGLKKRFSLRAARGIPDKKLDKTLIKLLKDKDGQVVRLAMEIAVERELEDVIPELEKLIGKSKDRDLVSEAIDTMSALRANDPDWIGQLLAYARDEHDDIRNSAIEVLGKTQDADFLPILVKALEHELWSTRLAAAKGLEHMKKKEGVGALCRRIPNETGRMAIELGEILFRLTGKPFSKTGGLWLRWWEEEGESFEFVTASELRRLKREAETRRLKQISRTSFFGIRIDSHRVTFILDVSGSMAELTRGQYVGQRGSARIDVARRELSRCLDSLDKVCLFNMIIFSGGVESWQEAISEKTPETLEDAKGFVARIHAGGGTNLHGALALAFEDPDVDTIYVLSDGEPTVGEVIDPHAIRQEVAEWNEHRGVVIHCISVGGSLRVLEWIAEDTGGTYVKFP